VDRDDFHAAFWAAKKAMAEAAEAAYRQHGVWPGQQFILQALWAQDGQTPGELAKRLDLATPTVTRTASRMAATGLLRREAHPSDARLVRLCLTDRGRELEDTMAAERLRLTGRALDGLSADEREHLVRLLKKVHLNLAGSR
jgi:DNA-binding MarR family transcriptional regulator